MHEKGWYQTKLTDAETGKEIISVIIRLFNIILRKNRFKRELWICGKVCQMFMQSLEFIENLEIGRLLIWLLAIGNSLNSLLN